MLGSFFKNSLVSRSILFKLKTVKVGQLLLMSKLNVQALRLSDDSFETHL